MARRFSVRSGIRLGRIRSIKPILAKWIELNDSVAKQWIVESDDAPWWYNERASVSFFAGAVWRSSGWALEEFPASKKELQSRGKRGEQSGRCDISFGLEGREYVAEAKQAWPNIDVVPNMQRALATAVSDARNDASTIAHWGLITLGMAFVAPRLRVTSEDRVDHYLEGFLEEILALRDATVAWTFPPYARHLRPEGRNRHRVYPGVAVVIVRAA